MVKGGSSTFNKYQSSLLHILSVIEGRAVPHQGFLQIYSNNTEIALAITIQNCIHPKNALRVSAIKDDTYVEIDSPLVARNYLK